MNRFCCDHLCDKGRNCPLEFKDTVPDSEWLTRWMAENSSPVPRAVAEDFADTEPAAPPGSEGRGIVLAALIGVVVLVILGVWHAYF
jgi:hypothetical protein